MDYGESELFILLSAHRLLDGIPGTQALCPVWCSLGSHGGQGYLYLLDLILDPLDGVAIDIIPGIHLLLAHCFGPDHCKTQTQSSQKIIRALTRGEGILVLR